MQSLRQGEGGSRQTVCGLTPINFNRDAVVIELRTCLLTVNGGTCTVIDVFNRRSQFALPEGKGVLAALHACTVSGGCLVLLLRDCVTGNLELACYALASGECSLVKVVSLGAGLLRYLFVDEHLSVWIGDVRYLFFLHVRGTVSFLVDDLLRNYALTLDDVFEGVQLGACDFSGLDPEFLVNLWHDWTWYSEGKFTLLASGASSALSDSLVCVNCRAMVFYDCVDLTADGVITECTVYHVQGKEFQVWGYGDRDFNLGSVLSLQRCTVFNYDYASYVMSDLVYLCKPDEEVLLSLGGYLATACNGVADVFTGRVVYLDTCSKFYDGTLDFLPVDRLQLSRRLCAAEVVSGEEVVLTFCFEHHVYTLIYCRDRPIEYRTRRAVSGDCDLVLSCSSHGYLGYSVRGRASFYDDGVRRVSWSTANARLLTLGSGRDVVTVVTGEGVLVVDLEKGHEYTVQGNVLEFVGAGTWTVVLKVDGTWYLVNLLTRITSRLPWGANLDVLCSLFEEDNCFAGYSAAESSVVLGDATGVLDVRENVSLPESSTVIGFCRRDGVLVLVFRRGLGVYRLFL